jgi:hypothetical protein
MLRLCCQSYYMLQPNRDRPFPQHPVEKIHLVSSLLNPSTLLLQVAKLVSFSARVITDPEITLTLPSLDSFPTPASLHRPRTLPIPFLVSPSSTKSPPESLCHRMHAHPLLQGNQEVVYRPGMIPVVVGCIRHFVA